jgi:RNA polymerase sigma-70 factor (ECF subfamily)
MDELLLARAKKGDEEAFEQLLSAYKQLIWSCCWKFMQNREDAEDCYVEAAARIWKGLESYKTGGSFKSWICTVTVNVCRNVLDAQNRRGKKITDSLNEAVDDSGNELEDAVPDEKADTEQSVIRKENLAELRYYISKLPEDQRQALVLVRLEGMSYAEAAEIEGVAEGTVKSRVNRAVRQLAEWMNPPGMPAEERALSS